MEDLKNQQQRMMMPPKRNGSPDDFYTPDYAIAPLIPYLNKDWKIWECACGTGSIVSFLSQKEFNIFGTDKKEGFDFLNSDRTDFDCVITNPPFSLKDKFLQKCFEIGKPFALLLPITALEGIKRQEMYKKYGIKIILFNRRINYKGHNSGSCWFSSAWFCWGLNLPEQLNFVELNRGEINREN